MEKVARYKKQWERCLSILKVNCDKQTYDTWFAPIVFDTLDEANNIAVLRVQSNYIYEMLEKDRALKSLLYSVLWTVYNDKLQIRYRILADSTTGTTTDVTSTSGSISEAKFDARTKKIDQPKESRFGSHLNEQYTFDTFVEGKGNLLLRSMGMDITKDWNDKKFNPFFAYGASGVGKTHLVNAIGMQFKRNFPDKKVLYVNAQTMKSQYMGLIRENRYNEFIYFYQSIDVLIIDDIQEIAGSKTLKAFFVIFNHLIDNGKRIIITSDQAPETLPDIEERLRSRFYRGLSAEMERPDKELCRKILENKIAQHGLQISDEVIDLIAQRTIFNIRELEGIISSLLAYSLTLKRDIDLSIAKQVLSHTTKTQRTVVTIEMIMERVCQYFGVSQEDVMGATRKANIVLVRQLAMYLASRLTKHPTTKIGLYIGKRNHSTVLHSIKNIQDRLALDANFQQQVKDIEEDLKHAL